MARASIVRLAIVGWLTVAMSTTAAAGQWDVVVNGKSFHVDGDRDWNESNWGLGFEHEFNPEARWVKLALGSGFLDSEDEMSFMGGGGIKRRFRMPVGARRVHVDVGAIGFIMTRQDVDNNEPFPGVLPAFSVGTRQFAVNLTYLPGQFAESIAHARTADPNLDGIVFLQFKFNSALFAFGGIGGRESFAANTGN